MDQQKILAEIDHAMTEVDLLLMEWNFGIDAMSFVIGEAKTVLKINVDDRPVKETKVTIEKEPTLHMRFNGKWEPVGYEVADQDEVPLVRYEGGKRIEIGTAKINLEDGTIDAIVNHEAAGFIALPDVRGMSVSLRDPAECSFFTEPETIPQKKWWASRVTLPKNLKEI